jgi:hypothetical protein
VVSDLRLPIALRAIGKQRALRCQTQRALGCQTGR